MRAVGIRAFGGPQAVEVAEIEPAEPRPDEVRVKVRFAGLNDIDVHMRRGNYLGASEPAGVAVLGFEGAGEIEAVGRDVHALKPGDRVAWCGVAGSHAEIAIIPAWRAVAVPDDMPLDIACALQLDAVLAHALTVSAFPVREGDRLLIQGTQSTSSRMLAQIAKGQGTSVIATVASESGVDAARAAGADHVFLQADPALAARVHEVTDGRLCNAVFDAVGQPTLAVSIACCRRRGLVLLYGALSAPVSSVNPDDLAAAGSIFLSRVHLPDYMQDATEVRWRTTDVFAAYQAGHLKAGINHYISLEDLSRAHAAMEAGEPLGKVLVKL